MDIVARCACSNWEKRETSGAVNRRAEVLTMCLAKPEEAPYEPFFLGDCGRRFHFLDRNLGAFAKIAKNVLLALSRPFVCLHETSRLLLDGFLWNLLFEHFFSKICGSSIFIKIGQEWRVLYMKTNTHFWSYLAQFFLEWEMFQTKVVEKIKTHILCSINFFLPKIVPFKRQCWKIL